MVNHIGRILVWVASLVSIVALYGVLGVTGIACLTTGFSLVDVSAQDLAMWPVFMLSMGAMSGSLVYWFSVLLACFAAMYLLGMTVRYVFKDHGGLKRLPSIRGRLYAGLMVFVSSLLWMHLIR